MTFESGHLSLSVLAVRTNEHDSKTNEKLEYLPALGENPVKKPAGRLGNDRKTKPESSENGEKCKNILKNKIKKC